MLVSVPSLTLPIGNPPPYQYHKKGYTYEAWNSMPSSPTTSSATSALTLEDIDIQEIFAERPNSNAKARRDKSLYEGSTVDFASIFHPIPRDDLNPHAAPFVPKQSPPKSRWLLRPDAGTMLPPRITRWKRTFNLATRPPIEDNDIQSLIVIAAAIVSSPAF